MTREEMIEELKKLTNNDYGYHDELTHMTDEELRKELEEVSSFIPDPNIGM